MECKPRKIRRHNGKLVCFKCEKSLSIFPIFTHHEYFLCGRWSCRSYLSNNSNRNNTLEDLLESREFPCGNVKSGCTRKLTPAAMEQHEEGCHYGFEGENICKKLFPHVTQYRTISSIFQTLLETPKSLVNHLNVFTNTSAFEIRDNTSEFHIMTTPENQTFAIFTTVTTSLWESLFLIKVLDLSDDTFSGYKRFVSHIIHGNLIKTPIQPDKTNVIPIRHLVYFKYQLEIGKLEVNNVTRCLHATNELTVNKDILAKLQCPGCKVCMTSEIFQCTKGHSFCGKCHEKLENCVTCHHGLDSRRNFALENVVKHIKFPCENANNGCDFVDVHENVLEHQAKCTITEQNCILRDYTNCIWKGGNGQQLLSHIQKDHENYMVNSNHISMLIDDGFFDKVHKTCYIILKDDPQNDVQEVILLNFLYKNETFYWGLQNVNEETKLAYEIEIYDQSDRNQYIIIAGKFDNTVSARLDTVKSFIKDRLSYGVQIIRV